jgi:hypothetical protein
MNEWLEKELEDYIAQNPLELERLIFGGNYEISVLGRQVHCQSGIIDVLMWARNWRFSYVLVVECKAKHEKGLAVEQVARYVAAVEDASLYDNLPEDAIPNQTKGRAGWMQHIKLNTIPVIVAPSFDSTLTATYAGVLLSAIRTTDGFALGRKDNLLRQPTQDKLDAILAPVIRRAHADAKAQSIKDSLGVVRLGDLFRRN